MEKAAGRDTWNAGQLWVLTLDGIRGEGFFAFSANPNNPSGFSVNQAHRCASLDITVRKLSDLLTSYTSSFPLV